MGQKDQNGTYDCPLKHIVMQLYFRKLDNTLAHIKVTQHTKNGSTHWLHSQQKIYKYCDYSMISTVYTDDSKCLLVD